MRDGARVLVVLATLTLVLSPETAFAQCAMCRRALQTPEGQQLAAALRSGILFLLAAPFAAFGAVATLAVRAERRRSAGTGVTQDEHRHVVARDSVSDKRLH